LADRLIVGRALAQVVGRSARAFFLKMLQQPSLDVRIAAIRGLGWCGNPQDMRILGAALRDENLEMRSAAVRSLRDMGTPGATTFLGKSLDQVDEALMLVIADALAELPEGPQALIDAADHPDLLVRRAVAQGLGKIDQAWAEEKLVDMIKQDPEWLVRSAAESALEAKEAQEAQQVTIPAPPKIDEIEWLMTWAAEQGMGLGVGEAAIDTLVLAAQEGRDDVKILSALTLARIGDESHIAVLEALREESAASVQAVATQGLQELQRRYPHLLLEAEA
jgi:HEAT repeat protein